LVSPLIKTRTLWGQILLRRYTTHESFLRTLSIYRGELEKLGGMRFEIGVKSGPQRGKLPQYVMLNENQAFFAATLSRNTQQVVDFKLKLTMAFAEARKQQSIIPI